MITTFFAPFINFTKKKTLRIFAVSALAICVFVFVSAFPSYASESFISDYDYVIFNLDNGLESTSINTVLQTSDGYIWFGTYSGLYRYDGTRFTLIDSEGDINNVRALFADSDNGMWLGTNDSGAACFYEDRTAVYYTKQDGLSSNTIRSFCEGTDGTIYIGTAAALDAVYPDGSIHAVTDDEDLDSVISMSVSESGVIAGVTAGGVLFTLDGDIITKLSSSASIEKTYSCVFYDEIGKCFIVGTSGSTVYSFKEGEEEITLTEYVKLPEVSGIKKIKSDELGGFWFCTDTGIVHTGLSRSPEIIKYDDFSSSISDVTSDYQGNYWFTSSRQGAMKLSVNPFRNISGEYELDDEVVNSVEYYNDCLYLGCDSGLYILNTKSGKKVENALTKRLSGIRVRNVFADSEKNLWISSYGSEGLLFVNHDTGEITSYTEESAGTLGSRFRFVTELDDGIILASSTVGLSYISEGKVIRTLGTTYGMDSPQILCVEQLDDGTVLAGSDGGGIYVLKGGRVYRTIGEKDGLTSLVVLRIIKYKDVYFVVTGSALFIMDKDLNIKPVTSFHYTNNYDIIVDEENSNVWILSSAGIFSVDGDKLASDSCDGYILYNKRSGLNTTLTANSWNIQDENGGLYFCCSTGLRYVSLKELSASRLKFKLAVNSVNLPDGTIIYPVNDSVFSGKFTVPASSARLEFEPVVLNYTLNDPKLHIYLEGLDENGIYVSQSELSTVSFTNVPYGLYYFHLQVLDEETGEPVSEAIYLVEKDAQFFEQPIFKIYLIIVAIGAIVFITWVITKIGSLNVIKRQYEEIRTARDEAEQANSAKSQFLANVSHEIRTPINTILGMDEMILRECNNVDIERYARDIKHSGSTLLAIVNDILDFSKIESGLMNIIPADYDIKSMISDLINMCEMKCSEKGLDFRCEISPNIPRYMYGDDLRIKQVITNLLSNAIKYTEKGYVLFKMRCEEIDGNEILLCVSVEDTGIGIKDEDQDKIFAKFERLDEKRNRGIEGTGLGLSISENLLEMMGSKLEFISEYGSGSVFGFSLRQQKISEQLLGNVSGETIGNDEENKGKLHHFSAPDAELLVVDDNKMNLEVVKGLLKGTLVKIDTARSGADCVRMAENKRYDIILLDHMMPEMDGVETLEKIRCGEGMCKDVPIIILTANAVSGSKQMYLEKGFDDYLSKPVNGKELEWMIMHYLPENLIKEPVKPEPKTETDNVRSQGDLKYINIETGLLYADGSNELLENIMSIYLDQSGKTAEMADNSFIAGDLKNYEIVIHSLKSTSLGIGAEKLSEIAKNLEKAASQKDMAYVRAHHDECMELYGNVCKEVSEYLGR
jgi:signal transduction histidine kinase/DNA-binding response OmpR family regulator